MFWSLAARAAADGRWMRRVKRHVWLATWGRNLLEMGMVCGVLGPMGPVVPMVEPMEPPAGPPVPT